MASVLAVGVAGCGASEDAETVDSGASSTATQTPSEGETSESATASGTATSTASATGTKTDGASTTLSEEDVEALRGLYAFEEQAQTMVGQIGDGDVSSDFSKVVNQVSSQAGVTMESLKQIAANAGVDPTGGEPDGKLSDDQVSNVGTPTGAEFEYAWKALMAQQRGAAAAFAKNAKAEDTELKSVVAQAATQLAAQQKALQ